MRDDHEYARLCHGNINSWAGHHTVAGNQLGRAFLSSLSIVFADFRFACVCPDAVSILLLFEVSIALPTTAGYGSSLTLDGLQHLHYLTHFLVDKL